MRLRNGKVLAPPQVARVRAFILKQFVDCTAEDGLSTDQVEWGDYAPVEVAMAMDWLKAEGEIYSTVEDTTYKATCIVPAGWVPSCTGTSHT